MTRESPPRLRGFDYTGFYRYFLTILTFKRSRCFADDEAVRLVVTQLARTAAAARFSVLAYCFMPDHLHILVEAQHESADFTHFVRMFKQHSAFHWKQKTRRILWHRSYFERVLRDVDHTIEVITYIVNNPVRAGLADRPEDYPYLGTMAGELRDLLDSIRL